jgi:hypothetical protein
MSRLARVFPLLICAVSVPADVFALSDYSSGVQSASSFIWVARYLTSGTHTVTASNLSGNPSADSVLHVLKFNATTNKWDEIAANDDCGGSLSSCVTFNASEGTHFIWVHPYATSNWGNADVVVDETTVLTQSPFAGTSQELCWNDSRSPDYSTIRLAGSGNRATADTMLFLNKAPAWYRQHDDDSLNDRYSVVSPNISECGIVYMGLYPGSGTKNVHLTRAQHAGADTDTDNVPDGLEVLLGSSPGTRDTDGDKIDDATEIWGNAGVSPTEFGSVIVKDVYVEIDYMQHANPELNRIPYANLPNDVASTFAAENTNAWVFIDQAVPWHEVVCVGTCPPGIGDGHSFDSYYNSYFLSGAPAARWFFHYALYSYRSTDSGSQAPTCDSGIAEVAGQGVIVSMGCTALPDFTDLKSRSVFMHELGHNLSLGHNGNDDSSPANANSTIHGSVMNYRYRHTGIPPSSSTTYSHGAAACYACAYSPKLACTTCLNQGQCGAPSCTGCDCDVNEWGSVQLAFSDHFTAPPWSNSGSSTNSGIKGAPGQGKGVGVMHADATRRSNALQTAAKLRAKGWKEGRDFFFNAERTGVYAR